MQRLLYAVSLAMFLSFGYILYCAYLFVKQFAGVIGMVATIVIFGVFISSCLAFGVYVWRSFALSERIAEVKARTRKAISRKKVQNAGIQQD